jgi:hypothetical protein
VDAAEEPDIDALTWAGEVFRLNGVRHFFLDGEPVLGVWSDLDGPHIREAMRIFRNEHLPVRYLDGPGIPLRFKARRMKGTPVPLDIVRAMAEAKEAPWEVRDRMLDAISWRAKTYVYVPASKPSSGGGSSSSS